MRPPGLTTLLIDTWKGPQQTTGDRGPLLLAAVQGIEGLSMPYAYDLTIYHSLDDFDIDPPEMINTWATIGMRGPSSKLFPDLGYYSYRRGVFQNFEKDETTHKQDEGLMTDYRVYKARIVPAFKMLDFEIRYRVFEDMTVLQIMQEVMNGFPQISSYSDYVDESNITSTDKKKLKLKPMPYCVQFGESSFNFLSRLMGLFDIWYYFDHQPDVRNQKDDRKIEKMFIGMNQGVTKQDKDPFDRCREYEMNVVYTAPEIHDISGFQRGFAPAHKKVWVSNFNPLNPTSVPRGDKSPEGLYEIWPNTDPKDPRRMEREVFPAPFDDPKMNEKAMGELADSKVQDEETNVFTVQGQCKNPTFVPGRTFQVVTEALIKSSTFAGTPSNNQYVISMLSFAAYENTYGHNWYDDVLNWLDSPLRWFWGLFRKKALTEGFYLDATAALAAGGLSNALQSATGNAMTPSTNTPAWLQAKLPANPNFGENVVSGLFATTVGSLVQLYLATSIKEALQNHADEYSNAFIALPWDPHAARKFDQLPNPDADKPRALGPHLAVVIGPDGTETVGAKKGDIYADALGRVRVRFPWQRDVPLYGYAVVNQRAKDTEPFQNDRRTCWVRSAEEWAGRHYGTQFLPRIGQEVIVSFLDGDPDRPIITGRVYNADKGTTNLPFPDKSVKDLQLKLPFPKDASDKDTETETATDLPATARFDLRFSGIKTASIPTNEKDEDDQEKHQEKPILPPRFNLLRFDDTRNQEQYLIRSQGRLDITAYNHRYETIGRNRNLTVGGKKITPPPKEIGGDYITKIFRHYHLHVGDPEFPTQSGNRVTKLEQSDKLFVKKDSQLDSGTYSAVTGNYYLHVSGRPGSGGGKRDTIIDDKDSLLVKADLNQMISGNWSTALAKQMSVRSDTTIVLEAFTNISLVVGGSSIVITPSSIAITSPMVLINSGGPPPASPIVPPAPPVNDPSIPDPQNPTQADSGSSLDPPEWQK